MSPPGEVAGAGFVSDAGFVAGAGVFAGAGVTTGAGERVAAEDEDWKAVEIPTALVFAAEWPFTRPLAASWPPAGGFTTSRIAGPTLSMSTTGRMPEAWTAKAARIATLATATVHAAALLQRHGRRAPARRRRPAPPA